VKKKSEKMKRLVRMRIFTEQKSKLQFAKAGADCKRTQDTLDEKNADLERVTSWKGGLYKSSQLNVDMYMQALELEQAASQIQQVAEQQHDQSKIALIEARQDMANKSMQVRVAEKRADSYRFFEERQTEKLIHDQLSDALLSAQEVSK
jgi:hypothetical protein